MGKTHCDEGELDGEQVQQILDVVSQANSIIDVIDLDGEESDERVERLFQERNKARQDKDFRRADALRNELRAMGIRLTDSHSGTRWERI